MSYRWDPHQSLERGSRATCSCSLHAAAPPAIFVSPIAIDWSSSTHAVRRNGEHRTSVLLIGNLSNQTFITYRVDS